MPALKTYGLWLPLPLVLQLVQQLLRHQLLLSAATRCGHRPQRSQQFGSRVCCCCWNCCCCCKLLLPKQQLLLH